MGTLIVAILVLVCLFYKTKCNCEEQKEDKILKKESDNLGGIGGVKGDKK